MWKCLLSGTWHIFTRSIIIEAAWKLVKLMWRSKWNEKCCWTDLTALQKFVFLLDLHLTSCQSETWSDDIDIFIFSFLALPPGSPYICKVELTFYKHRWTGSALPYSALVWPPPAHSNKSNLKAQWNKRQRHERTFSPISPFVPSSPISPCKKWKQKWFSNADKLTKPSEEFSALFIESS